MINQKGMDNNKKSIEILTKSIKYFISIARKKLYSYPINERQNKAQEVIDDLILEIFYNKKKVNEENIDMSLRWLVQNKASAENKKNMKINKTNISIDQKNDTTDIENKLFEMMGKQNDPVMRYELVELRELIFKCSKKVKNRKSRLMFFEKTLNGNSYHGLSKRYRMSEVAIKMRIYRAYSKILKCLRRAYGLV
jgi:hypothetical protein